MNTLDNLIKADLPYDWYRGPDQVHNMEDARMGANCIALAHLALRARGLELSPSMHCYEMVTDTVRLATVPPDQIEAGDIFWFGRPTGSLEAFVPKYDARGWLENWRDNPVTHAAVFVGYAATHEPLLLHASREEGRNAVWPLSRFKEYPRYAKLYRITRPRIEQA